MSLRYNNTRTHPSHKIASKYVILHFKKLLSSAIFSSSSEFLCRNAYKCIPNWMRCDGQNDCGDGTDEPASCRLYYCTQPGLFQCHNANSSSHCISPTLLCDGVPQCMDGSDELNCERHTCLESQFKCQNPPKCIPKSQQCNMVDNCEDSSDEKACRKLNHAVPGL